MPRTIAARSTILENRGSSSEIWTPGTAVSIGLKIPHSAISGLRSNVSVWGGPPSIQRTTTRLARALEAGADSAVAAIAGSQPVNDLRRRRPRRRAAATRDAAAEFANGEATNRDDA